MVRFLNHAEFRTARVAVCSAIMLLLTGAGAPRAAAQNCNVDPNDPAVECNEPADLAVYTVVGSPNVLSGETFTYDIVVKNWGPGVAYHPVVQDLAITSWMDFVHANGCSLAVRTDGGLVEEFSCDFALSTGYFCLAELGANHLNPANSQDPGLLIISIQATATEDLTLSHVTTVTSDCPDYNPDNNASEGFVMISATSDLSVTKTAVGEVLAPGQPTTVIDIANPPAFPEAPNYTTDPLLVTAGRRVAYQIEVTNNGPSTADNVVVRDRVPAGVTIIPGTLSASIVDPNNVEVATGSCVTGTPGDPIDVLECGLGVLHNTLHPNPDSEENDLRVRAFIRFDVLVDASLENGTVLENDANVRSDEIDLDNSNDRASTQTIVENAPIPVSDLRIVKFGKPDGDVQAGDELTYTVIVDNLGPDPATGVAIKDLMQTNGNLDVLEIESDRNMTCRSLPAADDGNPINVPPDDGATTGVSERYQLDCTLDDPLGVLQADGPPNSGRWVVTMRVRANEQQDIDNVADVLSAVADPNPSNNHAEVEHAINDVADLAIAKVADPNQGPPNGLVTYEITVTNNGPSTADNVVVTDIVPAEFAISNVTASQGVCDAGTPGDPTDPTICLLGTLAAGNSATIEVDVVLPPDEVEATYFNRATVVGDQYDPNNGNNLAVAPVTVVLPPPQTQPAGRPVIGLCGGTLIAPMAATMIGMVGFVGLRRRTRRKAA